MKKLIKKYTTEELKDKYWEFKKLLTTKTEILKCYSGLGGGSYSHLDYSETIQDFLIWLTTKGSK